MTYKSFPVLKILFLGYFLVGDTVFKYLILSCLYTSDSPNLNCVYCCVRWLEFWNNYVIDIDVNIWMLCEKCFVDMYNYSWPNIFAYFSYLALWVTRKPASRVFLAPPERLTKFLSSLYHAWQLLLAKYLIWWNMNFDPRGPPSPLGVRGQILIAYSVLSDGKVKPYQFGLATISGFWEHLSVPGLRTNRNQLVNIYMIAEEFC